jgi:hypothetical protein
MPYADRSLGNLLCVLDRLMTNAKELEIRSEVVGSDTVLRVSGAFDNEMDLKSN